MIPDEAVEAAAKALYKGQPIYDEEVGVITGHKPWEWMEPAYQEAMLTEARAALEAAAPHMPRTITTAEELDGLPVGSFVLDPTGLSLHKNEFTVWRASNGAKNITAEMLHHEALPATVIYEPEPKP